uniref:F-box domain-containing protein n=1 Tax=Glossina pallidipes TaxID=7398 RepID=A0A1A9ZM04_GLOPL
MRLNMDSENVHKPIDTETCPTSSYVSAIKNREATVGSDKVNGGDKVTELSLANEMWQKIFSNLPQGDLLQVNLVCKNWYQLTRAPALKRKSKLVITEHNLNDILEVMEHQDIKYENVEIVEKWDGFSSEDCKVLSNIFTHLGSDIVELKLYNLSSLCLVNNFLPKLRKLDLRLAYTCKRIKFKLDGQLQEAFKKFTQLEDLHIEERDMVYVKAILENLPKELVVRKWSKSLECLDLQSFVITGESAKALCLMSGKLRRLCLLAPELTPEDLLRCIAPTTNKTLTELEFLGSCLAGESFYLLVQRLPNLTFLTVAVSKLTDDQMCYIFRHLTRLRHLSLPPCFSETEIDYLKANISSLKRLQTLQLCLCPIKVMRILNLNFKFKKLNELYLQACKRTGKVSAQELLQLSTYFPALEKLYFLGLDFKSNDVQEMRARFPRLRRIEVGDK